MKKLLKNIATPLVASAIIVAGLAGAAATDAIPNPLPNAVAGNVIKATDINDLATAVGILDERTANFGDNFSISSNGNTVTADVTMFKVNSNYNVNTNGNYAVLSNTNESSTGHLYLRPTSSQDEGYGNVILSDLGGNVGVGGGVSDIDKLAIAQTRSSTSGAYDYQRGINLSLRPDSSTWDPSSIGRYVNGTIASVITDSRLTGAVPLTSLVGSLISYGTHHGTEGAITNAYGLQITPQNTDGTIGSMYDIYISPTGIGGGTSGGTITGNHYAIYQQDATIKNYFAAKTGIGVGTSLPKTALEVGGTVKVADGGETCDATIAGGIRYSGGNFEGCNGTAWVQLNN